MNSEFEVNRLDKVCELIIDCPHSTPKWTEDGIVVIRNQNIINNRLDLSNPSYTNEKNYQFRTKRVTPQGNDLIFTREAPMGRVCVIPHGLKVCQGQRQVLLRAGKNINPLYLFYAMQSPYVKHQISWNEDTGTTVSNVRIPVLKSINIPRHYKTEDGIANILSTLDDKIGLNRKMNQTLEEMAQTLFKSWFVDFDPVHAKADATNEADLEQIAKELGISKEVLDLFPDEFEDSELGMIPKGWEIKKLKDISKVTMGLSPKSDSYNTEHNGMPLLNGATDFTNGILIPTKYTTDSKRKAGKGELVFCIRATIGLLTYTDKTYSLGRGVSSINADTKYRELVYLTLNNQIEQMKSQASGSVFLSLKKDDIESLKVITAPDNLMDYFHKIQYSNFEAIDINKQQVQSLQKTRDTLLPKLLSGELDVSELDLEIQ